jgi:hypothetical protein
MHNARMPRSHPAVDRRLGSFIEERRIAAGYRSQNAFAEDLAPLLGIAKESARTMLNRWETGETIPGPLHLRAVAKATRTPYGQFSEIRDELRTELDAHPDPVVFLTTEIQELSRLIRDEVLPRLPARPQAKAAKNESRPRKRG